MLPQWRTIREGCGGRVVFGVGVGKSVEGYVRAEGGCGRDGLIAGIEVGEVERGLLEPGMGGRDSHDVGWSKEGPRLRRRGLGFGSELARL